ncbi:MFS transporter [Oligoflexus tunisiensis]|uniref:MFS transporter n=1 Tax=Oligoflexus tunisiensis TaxID=708132 RepID=UPI000ADA7EE5|nr:MFS transporter [Oligoflexus tunisiensis]
MEPKAFRTSAQPVLVLATVLNFVSLGSFMMVMPLGPDLVREIGLNANHTGLLSGGATFIAAVCGFLAAPYLDRWPRKFLIGLFFTIRSLLILGCGAVNNAESLIALFLLSGCVNGPGIAVLMASVIDATPPAKRGQAMAFVSSAFSLAAIIAVPLSLEMARWSSWRTPFVVFGLSGLLLAAAAWIFFPAQRPSSAPAQARSSFRQLLAPQAFRWALMMVAIQVFGHFLIVPNIANFFVFNLGFPRAELSVLYFVGGVASLIILQLCGRILDRGFTKPIVLGLNALLLFGILGGFVKPGYMSLYIAFTLFMAMSSGRTSVTTAIISKIPEPQQRASFMSLQGTVSNLAAGLAGTFSSWFLSLDTSGALIGMPSLGILSCACLLIALYVLVEGVLPRVPAAADSVPVTSTVPAPQATQGQRS